MCTDCWWGDWKPVAIRTSQVSTMHVGMQWGGMLDAEIRVPSPPLPPHLSTSLGTALTARAVRDGDGYIHPIFGCLGPGGKKLRGWDLLVLVLGWLEMEG